MRLSLFVLLCFIFPESWAGNATIPKPFHGYWAVSCEQPIDTTLRISAGKLEFHESMGVVKTVRLNGDYELFVTAHFTGEGETWEGKEHFVLAKDGKTLMSLMEDGTLMKRVRCH
jgi:hypothetical protein